MHASQLLVPESHWNHLLFLLAFPTSTSSDTTVCWYGFLIWGFLEILAAARYWEVLSEALNLFCPCAWAGGFSFDLCFTWKFLAFLLLEDRLQVLSRGSQKWRSMELGHGCWLTGEEVLQTTASTRQSLENHSAWLLLSCAKYAVGRVVKFPWVGCVCLWSTASHTHPWNFIKFRVPKS